MGRKKHVPTLADLGLQPELVLKIQDLREGFIGAPEHRVIAHAVEFYLDKGIALEPQVQRRYEAAREKRNKKT